MKKFSLGVTGGIGSGKTSVCRVFNVLGVPVFSADDEAKNIMNSEKSVADSVNEITGLDMYEGGSLNRARLAELIFNDQSILARINRTIHPLVKERFQNWRDIQESEYVILEAAILFESGSFNILDRVLTVVAPMEERIDRVMKRNCLTKEQVMERIRNQSNDDFKTSQSFYVINNADNRLVIPDIIKIHKDILNYLKNN